MDSQTSPSSSRPKRPDGITLIAGLNVIGGVTLALQGLFLSLFLIRFPYPSLFLIHNPSSDGIFNLVLGIFLLLIGWGLWEGKRWAWIIYVILAVLDILLSLITFNIYLLFLAAFILWYMFEPHVQRYFGMETEPTSSYTPSHYSYTPAGVSSLSQKETNPYTGKSPEDLKSELKKTRGKPPMARVTKRKRNNCRRNIHTTQNRIHTKK
jgi:hypothetical protein